jgi:gliding motility-associated-like protein
MLMPLISSAQPLANFTANKVTGCSPIVVQFTDQSAGAPTSWYWDLGNGTTSTLQNPSTVYIQAGTYTVSLKVTNAGGTNTKTMTNYITVAPAPTVSFWADSSLSCVPKTIQFNNTSTSPAGTSYIWDFGDGYTSTQLSPSHAYTTPGNYSISLTATNTNGCVSSLTKSNYIKLSQKPQTAFSASATASCSVPMSVAFTNTSVGAVSYEWNFGDGTPASTAQSPTHIYTQAGSYTVRLISTNATGCKDTLVKAAYITPGSLKASYTPSALSSCVDIPVTFINTTNPAAANYTWLFGDATTANATSIAHAYSTPGNYNVKLVADFGTCKDTATKTIAINTKPSVDFTANNTIGCSVPFSVQFTNNSTNANTYVWNFGNGQTSASVNPSYTYTSPGNYSITLTANSASGCSNSITRTNYINIAQSPSAGIHTNADKGCAPLNVSLTTTISAPAPVVKYSWNFGDGSPVQVCNNCPNMSYVYTSTGTFNVVLTYTTATGCSYTVARQIMVGNKPTTSFTAAPTTVCPQSPVTFTNSSTGANSYLWIFGDGKTSTATSPIYSQYEAGTYTVTLVASNNGCNDTLKKVNLINVQLPKADFVPSYTCANGIFTFKDESAGANTYLWNFGDGQTSTQAGNVTHKYNAYGVYTVKLTVTNATTGCTAVYSRQIMYAPMDVSFTATKTNICKGETITISGPTPSLFNSAIYRFGDGNSSNAVNNAVTKSYNAPGTYSVKHIVKDNWGCIDSLTKTNYIVVSAPTAAFAASPVTGCAPLSVNFQDQSSANGAAIANRVWFYGDNASGTSLNHVYTGNGQYSVKLVVTDAAGCKDSVTKTNLINASKPIAMFHTDKSTVCGGEVINFTNTSTGATSYTWNFGNGNTSSAYSPSYGYTSAGSYTVKLIANGQFGCKDSIIKAAIIKVSVPSINFTMSDTFAACPPLTVNFSNTSISASDYQWTFGNNGQSTLASPTTVYTYPGTYSIKLKGKEGNCQDSVVKTVRILGPTGTFSYNTTGCLPYATQFTAVTNNTNAYIWDLNNGVTQTTVAPSLSYSYPAAGKYVPKLILSDGASCLVPVQGIDTITVDKLVADFTFTPGSLCYSGTVQFNDVVINSISAITSISWNFGDGQTSTAHNPSHTYTAPGTYQVKMVVTNATGCTQTITKSVVIHQPPLVSTGTPQSICAGASVPVQLQATGAISYVWNAAPALSCTSCANPTVLLSATTTYTVVGTDANGCKDTADVVVTVRPLPTVSAGADKSICLGTSTQLSATGASNYIWSPATGLSCTACSNPVASPLTTTLYIVKGTDANGCSASDTVIVIVNEAPVVSAGTNKSICVGGNVQLQATGAASYTWSPATGLSCTTCANPIASPASTTNYTVTGTSATGCTATSQVKVTVNPLPNINVADVKVCAEKVAKLNATGAVSYTWSPATGLSCSTCPNPSATISSSTTYTVTGTDANGCVSTSQANVTVVPLPDVAVTGATTICEGTNAQLAATGASSYTWLPSVGLSCPTCEAPVASPSSTMTYSVVGYNDGCTDTAKVTITILPKPAISAGADQQTCVGGSVKLHAAGTDKYTWSPATGLSCTDCTDPVAKPESTTIYTLIGFNTNGCTNKTQTTVIVRPAPDVSAGDDKVICSNSSVTIKATGADKYTWSSPSSIPCTDCNEITVKPTDRTIYKVVGIDKYGCSDSDEVVVSVIRKAPVSIGNDEAVCKGGSVQLLAEGGDSYAWYPSTGLSDVSISNPTATPEASTRYKVVVKQGECFADTQYVSVVVHDLPTVDLGEDQRTTAGTELRLHAAGSDIIRYAWDNVPELSCTDCSSPLVTAVGNKTYRVKVYNQWGCEASDDVKVVTTCDASQIFVANTFTPNGDGLNDRFYPQGKGISQVTKFRVFNRWGELIFDANNIPLNSEIYGWDGTNKGEPMKPDVFVYILNATCSTGEPIELKGDISLIR